MSRRHLVVENLHELRWFCRCGQTFDSHADAVFHLRRTGEAPIPEPKPDLSSLTERTTK